jgi:hypothetical protein
VGTIISLAGFMIAVGALFLWGKREKRLYDENASSHPRKAA